MEKHEDGSVTLSPAEAREVESVLTWARTVYEAIRFQKADTDYAIILGLLAMLADD